MSAEVCCPECEKPFAETAHQQARSEWCNGTGHAKCIYYTIASLRASLATRDQHISELEAQLADWELVKTEPVVIGRIAVIKAARKAT